MGPEQAPNSIVFFGYEESPYACRVQHYLAFRNIPYAICVSTAVITQVPGFWQLTNVQDSTSQAPTARSQRSGHQIPPRTRARHRPRFVSRLSLYHTSTGGALPSISAAPSFIITLHESPVPAHHSHGGRSSQWCVLSSHHIHR